MALIPHSMLLLITMLMLFSKSTSAWQPTFLYNVCPETTAMFGNYSQYQTNLNTVFRSLSTNAVSNPTGFYNTSAGNGTKDVVYGSFLCRGDQNTTFCHNCVVNATNIDLPKYCPKKKVAFIAYDECIVRYSNENFFGRMEKRPRYRLLNTENITGNMIQFTEFMVNMLNSTAMKAANGGPKKKFATAVLPYTSVQRLYGLAQCTPDLSATDCYDCLKIAIKMIPLSVGGRTSQPSCIVRYEDYPFWNGAVNLSSPPPPPHPTNNTIATAPMLSPLRQPNGGKTTTKKVIVAVAVLVTATLVVLLAVGIHLITTRTKKTDYVASFTPADHVGEDLRTSESLQYDFSVLQCATNNFSIENKLGEGGFGGVYKGKLSNGQMIAVKRLSQSSGQGVQEFKNEVMVVAKLQHRNLVRLLGFCIAEEEKLLVYEYVPNNSLDSFIFDREKQGQLGWEKRYKILHGIARGMLYLHHDSRLRIIHRDLKASNILLDASMIPKISDFGMAKIFGVDQTQENTNRVVGTYGYMAPEYAMHGQFSMKSDVYSFGVLVLEIVSGKKNSTFYESSTDEDLLSYAWKKWKEGIPLEFVDPSIRDSCTTHEAIRSIHLGLLCAQESIDQRPTMTKVVLAFDTDSVTLPLPEEPTFSMKTMSASRFAKRPGFHQSSNTSTPWSFNEASITELEPR